MPTHLYCLLPAGSDSAPPSDAGSIRALEVDGIVAWVSDAPGDRLPRDKKGASREAVEHDRVIGRALARGITPVPASLADPYPSDAEVRTDISNRSKEIRDSLVSVDGLVEMAVLVAISTETYGEAPVTDVAPGRAYLERIRDLPARAAAIADGIDKRLGELSRASARRAEGGRVGLSHLVKRDQVDAYRRAALGFVSADYRILVDGPRAPYSFAAFSPVRGPTPAQAARHEIGKLGRDEKS